MIINGLGDTLPNEKVVIEILENAVPMMRFSVP
jgi:EAL and modified HD-GYP domain-containing signal transduction protein